MILWLTPKEVFPAWAFGVHSESVGESDRLKPQLLLAHNLHSQHDTSQRCQFFSRHTKRRDWVSLQHWRQALSKDPFLHWGFAQAQCLNWNSILWKMWPYKSKDKGGKKRLKWLNRDLLKVQQTKGFCSTSEEHVGGIHIVLTKLSVWQSSSHN